MFHRRQKRRAVAAVEFAFLAPLLLILLFGLWQIGRIVEVMQLMNNAAREGARLASQAQIINQVGAFTQIHASSGLPNVQDTVREYLIGNGVIKQFVEARLAQGAPVRHYQSPAHDAGECRRSLSEMWRGCDDL